MSAGRHRRAGFTLLELLVALAVFAVLAAMAYGGLRQVLDQVDRTEQRAARLGEVQLAVMRMVDDVRQAVERPARGPYGDAQPPLRGNTGVGPQLELTRGGWRNPARQRRSTLRRVGYDLEEERLVRLTWQMLDRAQDATPTRIEVLGRVTAFELRFLDDEQQWQDLWPPASMPDESPGLPRAIELRVELEDWGWIRRVVRVAG